MPSSYPAALPSYTAPTATDELDSLTVPHAGGHGQLQIDILALAATLGTNPQGASLTVKGRLEAIEANSWVGTARLADDAVTTAKIAAGAVGASEIADGAVGTSKLADDAVASAKIAAGAVGTAKLATGAVTPVKLALAYAAKTATYTATVDDTVLNFTSGASTLNLPAAATCAGREFTVITTGAATLTVDPSGAELIAGASTLALPGQGVLRIISTGTAWAVLSGHYAIENTSTGRRLFSWNPAFNSGVGAWQQIYGDTGWRDVLASIDSDWTGHDSQPKLYLRRTNSTGFVEGRIKRVTASGSRSSLDLVYALPSGFVGAGYVPVGVADNTTAAMQGLATLQGGTNGLQVKFHGGGTYAAGELVLFEGMWSITDSWPTSLPGSAVGTPA